MTKETLKSQIKEMEKQLKYLERKQKCSDVSKQINELVTYFAKYYTFGHVVNILCDKLQVSRGTFMTWACNEAVPRTAQIQKIESVYNHYIKT